MRPVGTPDDDATSLRNDEVKRIRRKIRFIIFLEIFEIFEKLKKPKAQTEMLKYCYRQRIAHMRLMYYKINV